MTERIRIGVIGGSGLYSMKELSDVEEIEVRTPFGAPSGPVTTGIIAGKKVAFISRHGRGHVLTPSEVNYRANIYALKSLGVRFIISVSACGSLKKEFAPGNIVIPDQLIDFTKGLRALSFFGSGLVAHVGTADPFCPDLSEILFRAVSGSGAKVHMGGSFITVEGPRFSTRGESLLFRKWGMELIGMTASPEAFLAREAEISYAVLAHVTDYDVWHEEAVTTEMVLKTFAANIEHAHSSIVSAVKLINEDAEYESHSALKDAIMTDREKIPESLKEKLKIITGKYF